jgi:uncharacterized protein with HEPN domain
MEAEVAKRLLDAVRAARRIQGFTAGLNFEGFSANELVCSAVERQFEIIGEALGKAGAADPGLAETIPALPKIVGLRNRLIHGYDSVDDEILWDVVQTKIPPLVRQLEDELKSAGYSF